MVSFAYETRDIQKLCEEHDYAEKVMGTEGSASLRSLLSDLDAADSVLDLPTEIMKLEDNNLLIYIDGGFVVEIRSNHTSNNIQDWNVISRICIVKIESNGQ